MVVQYPHETGNQDHVCGVGYVGSDMWGGTVNHCVVDNGVVDNGQYVHFIMYCISCIQCIVYYALYTHYTPTHTTHQHTLHTNTGRRALEERWRQHCVRAIKMRDLSAIEEMRVVFAPSGVCDQGGRAVLVVVGGHYRRGVVDTEDLLLHVVKVWIGFCWIAFFPCCHCGGGGDDGDGAASCCCSFFVFARQQQHTHPFTITIISRSPPNIQECEKLPQGQPFVVLYFHADAPLTTLPDSDFFRELHAALPPTHRDLCKVIYGVHPTLGAKTWAFWLKSTEARVYNKVAWFEYLHDVAPYFGPVLEQLTPDFVRDYDAAKQARRLGR